MQIATTPLNPPASARVERRPDRGFVRDVAGESMTAMLVVGDALVAFAAIAAAFFLRFRLLHVPIVDPPAPEFARYLVYCVLGAVLYVVVAGNCGLYDATPARPRGGRLERILRASVVWFFVFVGLALFLALDPPVSRGFTLLALGAMVAGQAGWRWTHERVHAVAGAGRRRPARVMVVGLGPAATAMAERFRSRGAGAYQFIGYVAGGEAGGRTRPDEPTLGAVDAFETLCAEHQPDLVFVADAGLAHAEVMQVARVCERRFIGFYLAASSFEVFTSCLRLRRVAGIPVMGVADLPANRAFNRMAKRAIDVAGALVGLAFSGPVMLVLAVLIKRESRGPVFYRQVRVGQNGGHFTILKMRSMRIDAEAASGAQWCVENDPRRTRIGEFMRRTNLDELPQFWNVLVGDMSLVGPRPERPELIPRFLNQIPYYQSRHSVKPGMTGWAQINGLRGNTDLGERIRHDLHYIENWTLAWDVSIALQTFFRVRNAY